MRNLSRENEFIPAHARFRTSGTHFHLCGGICLLRNWEKLQPGNRDVSNNLNFHGRTPHLSTSRREVQFLRRHFLYFLTIWSSRSPGRGFHSVNVFPSGTHEQLNYTDRRWENMTLMNHILMLSDLITRIQEWCKDWKASEQGRVINFVPYKSSRYQCSPQTTFSRLVNICLRSPETIFNPPKWLFSSNLNEIHSDLILDEKISVSM